MKTIIYAGIGLFTAASVYGIADYYSSEKKGQLKDLYQDAPAASKETAVKAPERDIELEDYSRGKIDGLDDVEPASIAISSPGVDEKSSKAAMKKKAVKRKAPKIKFSDFSRSKLVREKAPVVLTDSSTGKY